MRIILTAFACLIFPVQISSWCSDCSGGPATTVNFANSPPPASTYTPQPSVYASPAAVKGSVQIVDPSQYFVRPSPESVIPPLLPVAPLPPLTNVAPQSAVQTASQAAAPRTIDTTVHTGTYTTAAANTAQKTPVTSTTAPNASAPATGAFQPKKIFNPACDCYEFESDIAAVSNTNQVAAQQLLSSATTAGAVPWTATLDYARETALAKMEPYAIYFCSEAAARTAGESPAAKAEYKKSHDGRSPAETIFDNSGVLRAFDAAGIAVLVKVALTAENAKLAEKWNAHENTLIVAAPNDEKLKVFNREECNENNVAEYLMGFKEKYKMWKWKAQMTAVQDRNTQR